MLNEQAPQSKDILQGPRKLGNVPLAAGNMAVRELTSDGMLQTRIMGNGESAAEFHARKEQEAADHKAFLDATDKRGDPVYMEQWMSPEQRAETGTADVAQSQGDQLNQAISPGSLAEVRDQNANLGVLTKATGMGVEQQAAIQASIDEANKLQQEAGQNLPPQQ